MPPSSSFLNRTGEGDRGVGGADSGGPGPRGGAERRGKMARVCGGSIPQLTSARGAARERGNAGRRRRRWHWGGEAVVAGKAWVWRSGAGRGLL